MNARSITKLPLDIVRVEDAQPLSAADKIEIHELISRLFLAEDGRDRESLHQLVTENFTQEHSINIVTGADGADQAKAVSYIYVFQLFGDEDTTTLTPRLIAHGVVRDWLVKERGCWKIARRTYDQFSALASTMPNNKIIKIASETL